MSIDVWIGIVTIVMAGLGGVVSAHGPQKRWHKLGYGCTFVLLAAISIILIKAQADENRSAQKRLEAQLNRIQHNTEQPQPPPQVTVNLPPQPHHPEEGRAWIDTAADWVNGKGPPFKAGGELQYNVWFRNSSESVPARNFHMGYLAIEKDHRLSLKEEGNEYNKFLEQARKTHSVPPRILAPGSTLFITVQRQKLFSEKEAADVAANKLWTYFFALAQHTEEKGNHETEVCTLYSGTGPTAVNCISHNGPTF